MDRSKPKVSVILPVFNAENYLKDSIQSILNQSYRNYEVIAVDDGSSDNSLAILRQYEEELPNFKVIVNQENKGNSFTLNQAIDASKGEYTMRMDADDIIDDDKIKKQVTFLAKNPDIDVVGCGYHRITNNGEILFTRNVPVSHKDIVKLLDFRKFWISGPNFEITDGTLMAKTSWFKKWKYDANIFYSQDFELICRSLSASKFANLSEALYYYRIGSGVTANHNAQKVACKVKKQAIKNNQFEFSIVDRFLLNLSLALRPFLYRITILFHKIKN